MIEELETLRAKLRANVARVVECNRQCEIAADNLSAAQAEQVDLRKEVNRLAAKLSLAAVLVDRSMWTP